MSRLACARRLVPAVLPAITLLWVGSSSAATVILVPPAAPSVTTAEALVRVRGELISEGFEVEVIDGQGDLRRGRDQADAVVALLGDQVPDSVEIRIVDRHTDKLVVRRMPFHLSTDTTAKALAIHTLELVRATFLEMDLVPAPRQPQPRPLPPIKAEVPAPRPERVSVNVGATAVFDLDERAPSVLPLVQVSWALRPWLLPHLTAAGLGTQRTIHADDGAIAQLAQQFAVLGASVRLRVDKRLRPFLSLSAGVLHTLAKGQADPPYRGLEAEQWSFLIEGAAGAWLALGDRFQVGLALQAQLAEPYAAIRFAGSVAGTSTHPSLLLTLMVGSWL